MPIDNYQAKRKATLENREYDLLKLLSSECSDNKKLSQAGELVKKAHLRLLRGKLEWAELQWQLEISQCMVHAVGKEKSKYRRLKSSLTKQIPKLKTNIEYWENLSVEKVIDKYRKISKPSDKDK